MAYKPERCQFMMIEKKISATALKINFNPTIFFGKRKNTGELMPIDHKSKPFSFFFALRILPAFFRRDILMITFFDPALDFTQWQPSIFSGNNR